MSIESGKSEVSESHFFGKKWYFTLLFFALLTLAFFYSFPFFFKVSFIGVPIIWFSGPALFLVQGITYIFYFNKDLKKTFLKRIISITGNTGVFMAGVCFGTFFSGSGFMITTVIHSGKDFLIIDFNNPAFGLGALLNITNLFSGLMILFLSRTLALLYLNLRIENNSLQFINKKELFWNFLFYVAASIAFFTEIFLKKGCAFMPDTGLVYFEKYKYLKNLIELPVLGIIFLTGIFLIFYSLLKLNVRKNIFYIASLGSFLIFFTLFTSLGFNNTAFYPSNLDFQSGISVLNGSAELAKLYKVSYGSVLVTLATIYVVYSFRRNNH